MSESPLFSRAVKPGDHVFLVDGSGYIYRAFHALPPLTRKSDGLQVGAVAGFCNMLWKLLQDASAGVKPTHLAVVFDKSEHTFRNEMYDQYKAHRPEAPDDLKPQFGLIRKAVAAFNVASLEQSGFEADDLIATYARLGAEAGADVTVVSSDKDLMQLVGPTVTMYDTMKDKRIGAAEVVEKFGVGPDKVIEVQALIGDSTDNVPGVPGIGVKTAAQLIAEFGDLETLLSRTAEIKQPKRREALEANADNARLSKKLVTLDRNVALDVPIEQLAVRDRDGPMLIAFCKAMEFTALTRRVAEATKTDIESVEPGMPGETPSAKAKPKSDKADVTEEAVPARPVYRPYFNSGEKRGPNGDAAAISGPGKRAAEAAAAMAAKPFDLKSYETISTVDRLDRWIAEAEARGAVAIDVETNSLDPMQADLCGISIATEPGRAAYLPLGHTSGEGDLLGGGLVQGQVPAKEGLARLKPLLENPSVIKVAQNLKFDYVVFAERGIAVAPYDDTMLMSYALDGGKGGSGMDELAEATLGHKPVSFKDVAGSGAKQLAFDRVAIARATEYSAEDADVALRLWTALKPRLAAERMVTVYETLERPLIPVLARMEARGIKVDRQILSRMSGEFAQKLGGLEHEIYELAGETFNIGSPKQLGDILFGKFSLPGGKKTKTGAWATGADVLEELAASGQVLPTKILEWRQLSKLKSTYTDLLPTYIHPVSGRVHTSYALASTTTGRLSSSDPNLQNIPVRTDDGRRIRTAFIAEKGMKLISADYSQIELRIVAHVADVPELKLAFADGLDIHAMTASEMFGVPVKGMPVEVRRRAKAINFGIIYGISAFGLANQLGIPREEAGAYIKRYFERFPGIRAYMDAMRAQVKRDGYVSTLFGRKIHFPQAKSSNPAERAFVERASINAPIQGTAADIIRRAMIRMEDALSEAGLAVRMLLQVHDELVFEAPEGEATRAMPVIAGVMERAAFPAVNLSVPLQVDAKAGDNWDAAH
ncbi:MAG TPA: DNA polymerase I [Bauldia sp.]